MLRRLVLALSSLSMLAAGLSGGASAQGLFGAPPPKASSGNTSPPPAQRQNFTDPAKTVLDKSDALRASGQGECLDPNMALDNADYDKLAIDRSLRTIEAVNGDEAKVVVAFVVEGHQHRLEWKLKKIGGAWKVSDLLSVTGEWALSQYQCE
ncbi:MAG: hypothetical protein E5V86_25295 [Mesorhizobium sp.]|nr:MAG: hypothetical protein E5V86_25295 [Mesorhizobium sp.]